MRIETRHWVFLVTYAGLILANVYFILVLIPYTAFACLMGAADCTDRWMELARWGGPYLAALVLLHVSRKLFIKDL